ncbi:uncharacterized protein BcabD6B2_28550 [Babesia caballi]|uniref:Uncharacterized protein n=1 Tax=Babesia caballi TaxID=5871 RepID=A0AAV4LUZ8_BABCB|nr:hypothetical protein BcabD6B2_28550 [Babesia caballi]
MEQHRALRHHANAAPQTLLGHSRDVHAVHQNPPARHVVHATQQQTQSRLPSPSRTHNRQRLPLRKPETHVIQRQSRARPAQRRITETDVLKLNHWQVACCGELNGQFLRALLVNRHRLVEQHVRRAL